MDSDKREKRTDGDQSSRVDRNDSTPAANISALGSAFLEPATVTLTLLALVVTALGVWFALR